ncbi:hypothetical protein [Candidatus Babela massiliensis]|uniref:Uncharacterized protein n=1 Tax=Candidatus Babela massiliensis TaxID=673862 RepID=V6DFV8_9BACT|nr:hypothetical protein [Candidatus Babela massiliensis]CDK30455.1 hypothetical protein BABL1_gene_563 [Candidatus Babela massiliensis]
MFPYRILSDYILYIQFRKNLKILAPPLWILEILKKDLIYLIEENKIKVSPNLTRFIQRLNKKVDKSYLKHIERQDRNPLNYSSYSFTLKFPYTGDNLTTFVNLVELAVKKGIHQGSYEIDLETLKKFEKDIEKFRNLQSNRQEDLLLSESAEVIEFINEKEYKIVSTANFPLYGVFLDERFTLMHHMLYLLNSRTNMVIKFRDTLKEILDDHNKKSQSWLYRMFGWLEW